jgi:hypothetical protein
MKAKKTRDAKGLRNEKTDSSMLVSALKKLQDNVLLETAEHKDTPKKKKPMR